MAHSKEQLVRLRDGKLRLETFQTTSWVSCLSPLEMAEAGFHYLQLGDDVQCVFCEVILNGWQEGDDPLMEHFKNSHRCPFLVGYDVKNIPVIADPVRGPNRRLPSFDVCRNQLNDESQLMNSEESDEHEEESTASPSPIRHGPTHTSYGTFESRFKSFENPLWPPNCPKSAHELAEAGFFYYGPFMSCQDSVKCFSCDTGLGQWEPTDDPWKEHKRVSPSCEYIMLNYPCNVSNSPVESSSACKENPKCIVCWVEDVGCILQPCNHVIICTKCAPILKTCPLCRQHIVAVAKVFLC